MGTLDFGLNDILIYDILRILHILQTLHILHILRNLHMLHIL